MLWKAFLEKGEYSVLAIEKVGQQRRGLADWQVSQTQLGVLPAHLHHTQVIRVDQKEEGQLIDRSLKRRLGLYQHTCTTHRISGWLTETCLSYTACGYASTPAPHTGYKGWLAGGGIAHWHVSQTQVGALPAHLALHTVKEAGGD